MRDYCFEDIIRVVKRERNVNRKFLFLNLLQGKYVPSNPKETLELFETLGRKLAEKYDEKQICVIGFAETATAVAAAVAGCFCKNVYFLHTTREELPKEYFVTEFQEEHSHAKRHRLYCKNKELLQRSDVLILIDDEFTTGKTVCNFVKSLRENHWIGVQCKVIAASLINCMKEEHLQRFVHEKIEYEYLLRKDADWEKVEWKSNGKWINIEESCGEKRKIYLGEEQGFSFYKTYNKQESDFNMQSRKSFDVIRLSGKLNPRLGVCQSEYQNVCEKLALNIMEQLQIERNKTEEILLLGTEECMYPIIYAADRIQKMYPKKQCYVHATSRSPIAALKEHGYPIYSRDKVVSFYEKGREVFLYNLRQYDQVVILTDAEKITEEAKYSIETVMENYGNINWKLLQWLECV